MEIHNSHGNNLKVNFPTSQNAKTTNGAGGVEGGNTSNQVEQVKPQGLLNRLEGDVKAREQLLVEVQAKVQAGEYSTREAAVETAQRIVDG